MNEGRIQKSVYDPGGTRIAANDRRVRDANQPQRPRRSRSPTPQDGALGAGSTSALVISINYITDLLHLTRIPPEIIALAAPFASLVITYIVTIIKNGYRDLRYKWDRRRMIQILQQELEKEQSGDRKERYQARLEILETGLIEERWQSLSARHEELMSSASTNS